MGVNLDLLPLRSAAELGETETMCVERLTFDQDYQLFGQLIDMTSWPEVTITPSIPTQPIPPGLWFAHWDGGDEIELVHFDSEGDPFEFVYAIDLKGLALGESTSPKNRAIKAYVDELPDETPIILEWR